MRGIIILESSVEYLMHGIHQRIWSKPSICVFCQKWRPLSFSQKPMEFIHAVFSDRKTLIPTSPEWGSAKLNTVSLHVESVLSGSVWSHTQYTHTHTHTHSLSLSLSRVSISAAPEARSLQLCGARTLERNIFTGVIHDQGKARYAASLLMYRYKRKRVAVCWRILEGKRMCSVCLIMTVWMRSRVLWKPIEGVWDLDSWRVKDVKSPYRPGAALKPPV